MRAVVASIVAHGALIAALVAVRGEREVTPPRPEPALIEVIVVPPKAPIAPGASGKPTTNATPKTTPRRTTAATRSTRGVQPAASATVAELLATGAELGFDDGGGAGGGSGGGAGGRGGHGGLGVAAGGSIAPRAIALPPPPKVSKARKAKLIYPTRERPIEEPGELFVASVDVDHEGYVVGARLKAGMGPRRDDAAGLIFKFRYLPALDDDGRAIRSTFDQPFTVGP